MTRSYDTLIAYSSGLILLFRLIVYLLRVVGHNTEWIPSLWTSSFATLLDDELDYADQWTMTFNYHQTDDITPEERKKGWKVSKHCAFGEYVNKTRIGCQQMD